MQLSFPTTDIKKIFCILTLVTIFSFDCFARPELETYKCEIFGMLANGSPLVANIPSPISVNSRAVNHILYVTFEGVETLRVGFSPYEGQLHILAEKKNAAGRFRPLVSTKAPLGSPKLSLDLSEIEGATTYINCVLLQTNLNEGN